MKRYKCEICNSYPTSRKLQVISFGDLPKEFEYGHAYRLRICKSCFNRLLKEKIEKARKELFKTCLDTYGYYNEWFLQSSFSSPID